MGITELEKEELLLLARRIVLFNSQTIYNIKNSLMIMTEEMLKEQKINHEKFSVLIKNNSPGTDTDLIVANPEKNINHDMLKLDVDLIFDTLVEGAEQKNGTFNAD